MNQIQRSQKHAAIRQYLTDKYPGCPIELRNDFDRGAQSFKVSVANDSVLLKVADEFVDDNEISRILQKFDEWDLYGLLNNEHGLGVIVTANGADYFERD